MAVVAAAERAVEQPERAARDVNQAARRGEMLARLTSGLDTQLGPTWPGGTELSFGQCRNWR